MNCWEFKQCGREQGGINAEKQGVCPAYPDYGNACAAVAGTLCGGFIQGSFALKLKNCLECDFYRSPHSDSEKIFKLVADKNSHFQYQKK